MAKPIRATPTLVGEEAVYFVDSIRAGEHSTISNIDKELIRLMHENKKLFRV